MGKYKIKVKVEIVECNNQNDKNISHACFHDFQRSSGRKQREKILKRLVNNVLELSSSEPKDQGLELERDD